MGAHLDVLHGPTFPFSVYTSLLMWWLLAVVVSCLISLYSIRYWDSASRLAQLLFQKGAESWAQTSSRSSASLGSAGEEDPSAM